MNLTGPVIRVTPDGLVVVRVPGGDLVTATPWHPYYTDPQIGDVVDVSELCGHISSVNVATLRTRPAGKAGPERAAGAED